MCTYYGSIGKYQKLAIRKEHIKKQALNQFQDNMNLFFKPFNYSEKFTFGISIILKQF